MSTTTPTPLTAEPTCAGCQFNRLGYCHYIAPPIVAQLYAMLAQEPGVRIDYAAQFENKPGILHEGCCSEFWQRQDA